MVIMLHMDENPNQKSLYTINTHTIWLIVPIV